jgi:hypothetical protein
MVGAQHRVMAGHNGIWRELWERLRAHKAYHRNSRRLRNTDSNSYAPNGERHLFGSPGLRPKVTEEPDALIGHVRVCGGSGGQPLLLPGTTTRLAACQPRARAGLAQNFRGASPRIGINEAEG